MQVGEVATSAAGDQDFLADALGAFENEHVPAASSGLDGTHQASGTGSKDDRVVSLIHASISLSGGNGTS